MKNKILLIITLMMFNSIASAENWYVDGGLALVTFDDGIDELSPTNVYINGGYTLNPYFSIGVEVNVTVSPDQISGLPGVDFDVDTTTFYIRAATPLSQGFRLYAQLGSSSSELTASAGGFSASVDDSDTMMGVGVEIDIGDNTKYLAINYSIYNNNNELDIAGFNVGLGLRF